MAAAYSRGSEKATSSISRMKKATVSKGAHILRCAACRKDGYNAGLNAYQLKKCFDVGLDGACTVSIASKTFPLPLNYPSRKIRISVEYCAKKYRCTIFDFSLWYINYIYKFFLERKSVRQIFCELFSQV